MEWSQSTIIYYILFHPIHPYTPFLSSYTPHLPQYITYIPPPTHFLFHSHPPPPSPFIHSYTLASLSTHIPFNTHTHPLGGEDSPYRFLFSRWSIDDYGSNGVRQPRGRGENAHDATWYGWYGRNGRYDVIVWECMRVYMGHYGT